MASLPDGITATPGRYGYGIVNEDLEVCATITSGRGAVVTEEDLEPVAEEQSVAVRTGELTVGSIYGMDAQVILRAGGLTRVPARVFVGPYTDGRRGEFAAVTLALAIDATTVPREPVAEGCARTPGAYAQHVQGCHKYTKTLRWLCPDDCSSKVRAVLRPTEGGFLVTIDGADVGTVLTRDAAYASANVAGGLEVDAVITKRQGKGRAYAVHLAVELARPAPA